MTIKLVYIASGFENADRVRDFAKRLPPDCQWAYDWTGHTFDDDPLEVARKDLFGISRANVVVVLTPGGPGTHVELGFALACGKRVIVVGDPPRKDPRWPRCPFYTLPQVEWVMTEDEAMERLANRKGSLL